MVKCPNCSTTHAEAARFCARCGTPLHAGIDRRRHFAAMPDEPVRALAVMSTLMPHLSGGRHSLYRIAVGVVVLAALTAAAFGVLSVALVLAAVALPAVVLAYIYDLDLWHGRPMAVIGVGVALPLALGVAVGLLQQYFAPSALLAAAGRQFPSLPRVLELGVLLPVVIFVAVLIAPMLITAPAALRHPIDAVVACSLSGAAFSLGLSVMVQHGAFTRVMATAGEPAQVAFIAITLGLLQPIVFATAAAIAVIRLRQGAGNPLVGVAQGLALVVAYELVTTVLAPSGTRGVVLTALAAALLAVAGLAAARDALHKALIGEAKAALGGARLLTHPAHNEQICAHCGAALIPEAAFCQVCGTASAALSRYIRTAPVAAAPRSA